MKAKEFQKKENVRIIDLGWRHYKYVCNFCEVERQSQASMEQHLITYFHPTLVATLMRRVFARRLSKLFFWP